MAEQSLVRQAKELHKADIMAKPNVVGVGTGFKVSKGVLTDQICVVALVREKLPPAGLDPQALIPREVSGVPTDVIEVGELRPLQARTDRWRPAPPGVSIGHYQITAGTFGGVVRDNQTGDRLILSNNHVMANSNNANVGDPILQPGPADGGQTQDDTLARLVRFVPIQFTTQPGTCNLAATFAEIGNALAALADSSHRVTTIQQDPGASNLVDAAVARPLDDASISDDILGIGALEGTTLATLGMPVRKSGRTTEFTTGQITVMDATVEVNYGTGRTARFDGQILTGAMSQGGDSGSLLVDADSLLAVGLLFAGSNQVTIYNPIQAVLDSLEVSL